MQIHLLRSKLGRARRIAGRATNLARSWLARHARAAAPPSDASRLRIHRLDDRAALEALLASTPGLDAVERALAARHPQGTFTHEGVCWVDGQRVGFHVDYEYAAERDGRPWPNWRERLICPLCAMNNRQRAMVHVATEALRLGREARIYLTEQVSAVHRCVASRFPRTTGSEYLGPAATPGSVDARGVRHEDLTQLTLPDASVDAVLTFDVLEHVPDYRRALAECHRVLAPGGALLLTAPFLEGSDETRVRATLDAGGEISHHHPALYHGDPVQPDKGVLCYQEFGWDLLERLREAGFVEATVLAFRSPEYGYLGGWQLAFAAWKAAAAAPSLPAALDREALLRAPQVGEYAWHAFTADPTLERTSLEHLGKIDRDFAAHGLDRAGARLLEVGAYRHYTGYLAADRWGMEVTLTDIAASSLRSGLEGARAAGLASAPRLVAADFHDLPMGDAQFDAVFVASSVHHTRTPEVVLREMLRVLRPGGLLLLENEPCARIACFQRFCSNRPELYTPLERYLAEHGLLQTVSSPFPGSRAEEVFGMVENDRIPAALFRSELEREGEIVEWRLQSLAGPFESSLLATRGSGAERAAQVAHLLRNALAPARGHLGETDRLLGFSLPDDAQIDALAARIAAAMDALPPSGEAREAALAALFGASLKAVARKRGSPRALPAPGPRFRRAMHCKDGVWEEAGTHRGIAAFLGTPTIPDVYRPGNLAALARWFPPGEWRGEVESHGALSMLNLGSEARIRLDSGDEGVLLLRLYAVPLDQPFALEVSADGRVLDRQVMAIAESRLVRAWIPAATHEIGIALRTLQGEPMAREGAIRVGVAQFLPVVR